MTDGYNELAASRQHWDEQREAKIAQLEAELAHLRAPNEGPINDKGFVVLPDGSGVLPPFYTTHRCSQCGRDSRWAQLEGCGMKYETCGRTAQPQRDEP